MKRFLWIGLLASCLQTAVAFSLLGPAAVGDDSWQVVDIGYASPNGNVPPYIGDGAPFGPKNQGEGYRRNTPVMYYTFDPSFGNYFGSNGEYAVQQAFDIMNSLTNVDSYSANLSEFPLNSQSENYTAYGLNLQDVKSFTLTLLMEQLGLTDAVRYTWTLHDRVTIAGCTAPCPLCLDYLVVMRNFDYYLTPLGYNPPDWGQYSPLVNGELYTYYITENCGIPNPPDADAVEIPLDRIIKNPPVASGHGETFLLPGFYYTGLTRDDMAGLRWLYSTNNWDTPSLGYRESPAAGSVLISSSGGGGGGGLSDPFPLYTSNYTAFAQAALTNGPVALSNLFPGLVITSSSNYFVVVSNLPVQHWTYIFANVVIITNDYHTNTSGTLVTIETLPNQAYGNPPTTTTNTASVTLNDGDYNTVWPSGDYYIDTNTCGPIVIVSPQPTGYPITLVGVMTNVTVTNINKYGYPSSQTVVTYSTNHIYIAQAPICAVASTNTTTTNSAAVGDYQGIGRIQFVRVSDGNYDSSRGVFYTPISQTNTMILITNGNLVTRTFQRVVTAPDFVFRAQDREAGPASGFHTDWYTRSVNFNQANIGAGLAGPGTIDPPTTITYNKVGVEFMNESPSFMNGPNTNDMFLIWGSFDGTTNPPVIYPNGTSIENLAAGAWIQVSPPPPTLPDGTNSVPYNVALSATGGTPSYTWSFAPGSAGLPPGLVLTNFPAWGIYGTPTNCISGSPYDNIVIRVKDSSYPTADVVDMTYSITIH